MRRMRSHHRARLPAGKQDKGESNLHLLRCPADPADPEGATHRAARNSRAVPADSGNLAQARARRNQAQGAGEETGMGREAATGKGEEMTDAKLVPCPFCGWTKAKCNEQRRGNYRREGDNYQVVCNKCKARGPLVQDSPEAAINGWNEVAKRAKEAA